MEDVKEFLRSIGLGKNDADVYVTLVKNGISSVLEISKDTRIHRSNIYEALDNLLKKGLIFEITKDKKKLFYARPPSSLLDYLRNREIELKMVVEKLESEHSKHNNHSRINMTEGKFGLREAIMSMLETGEPISVFGIPAKAIEEIGPIMDEFHKERVKKGIHMRHIYNSDGIDRIHYLNSLKFTEAKHLPSKYDSPVSTNISGNKVILILWNKDYNIIEIEDEDIAKSYLNYFEILWRAAKTE